MAVSWRDPALAGSRITRRSAAAEATPAGLDALLRHWRAKVPEADRLTLQAQLPRGIDPARARTALMDLLASRGTAPRLFEHQAVAFELASTGSAAAFCRSLADIAMATGQDLVLDPCETTLLTQRASPPSSDLLRSVASALQPVLPAVLTLPCRWQRSADDAQWAAEQGLPLRLVPGHAADPRRPQQDPGAALRTLLRQVAGRVPHVTLAWPDPGAAHEALRLLGRSATACDLEVGACAPLGALRQLARSVGVPLRLRGVWQPAPASDRP